MIGEDSDKLVLKRKGSIGNLLVVRNGYLLVQKKEQIFACSKRHIAYIYNENSILLEN